MIVPQSQCHGSDDVGNLSKAKCRCFGAGKKKLTFGYPHD